MNFSKYLSRFFLLFFFVFVFATPTLARENIDDWYIKDFKTEINVNKDSSLDITEIITADCGEVEGKHGIFRVLPLKYKTIYKDFITPIEIIGVFDENDNPISFTKIKDREVISLKIGDPDIEVSGVNIYVIKYKVKNAILFENPDFAELYWDLLGNYWELEIDNFTGKIIFPSEINKNNSEVYYYTGYLNSQETDGVEYKWTDSNILEFKSLRMFKKYEGISVSIIFPKNIITPYVLTFKDKTGYSPITAIIGLILLIFLPLFSFLISYKLWKKHGRDPKINKTIIPEFEIPGNLSPIDMGGIIKSGALRTNFITASIVNLAVNSYIKIEERDKRMPFSKKNDYAFIRLDKQTSDDLSATEKVLLKELFSSNKKEVLISDLKDDFYKNLTDISKSLTEDLVKRDYIFDKGLKKKPGMLVFGIFCFFISIYFVAFIWPVSLILILTGFPVLIFGILMSKRTELGTEMNWRIKGFKLYMNTAEKYRSRFQEKENIIEKLLPYAVLFGITKKWLKKMKDIYGEEYFSNYHPVFFSTISSISNFDSFASSLNSITSSISSNVSSSSSGSSGGGSSGGGGGGGGGGGW